MKQPTRRQLMLVAGAVLAVPTARARTVASEVAAELPGAKLQGSSTMRFIGMRVYDARLWTAGGAMPADWSTASFALELEYARELKGEQIAERSLAEMRRQGPIAPDTAQRWLDQMKQLFPDVKAGDRITGVNRAGQGARFFLNGQPRGDVADGEFARFFFGIWLSPRTSEPALRTALLGTGT